MDSHIVKKLMAVLLAFSGYAYADGNDLLINQRNALDTATTTRVVASPLTDGLLYYNTSTLLPSYLTLGTGLSITSGVLSASAGAVAWTDVTGKPSFATIATTGAYADLTGKPSLFDGAYSSLTGVPSTFTPSSHTHTASQISDSTTAGRAVMTATDAAAARTAIGAGTGNGTVTSVVAGTGLSGGTITSTGTISLPNTGTASTYSGVTTDAQGRVTAGTTRSFNSSPTKTLVTSASGQGGVVLDASRDAFVAYWIDTSITTNIGGTSTITLFLEVADTNSATPGDWTAIAKTSNGNTITLAIALQSQQPQALILTSMVRAGKFVRIRYATAGTASASYGGGQEVLM